jgi:hypothetical protein
MSRKSPTIPEALAAGTTITLTANGAASLAVLAAVGVGPWARAEADKAARGAYRHPRGADGDPRYCATRASWIKAKEAEGRYWLRALGGMTPEAILDLVPEADRSVAEDLAAEAITHARRYIAPGVAA